MRQDEQLERVPMGWFDNVDGNLVVICIPALIVLGLTLGEWCDRRDVLYICPRCGRRGGDKLPITEEWLLELGCTWCPCNIHGTPDTDLLHPTGLQFWKADDRWACLDPQVENLRTRGDVIDLLRLTSY